ncbi:uncharacterized protein KQ657_002754 [Scheffersomyces spartinae]|uniref:Ankyrin n=1 Tax=Scheffersomyces spartinae TaxID=45513 RepID=A0A9P7V5Z7_9ASCO|nr:uncharacterized protein KQ657_002754 [Scheffersomyces spartinae]KAG7191789.1 hypothetical protein KQ657_002754 [Scheffersomyces spartinae]
MSDQSITSLTQEEMDAVLYDAREGDLQTLQEIFSEVPAHLLKTIKDEYTLSNIIHMAAGNGHLQILTYLLGLLPRADAVELASQVNDTGNTPLHWAAYNGHLDIVKVLVEEYEGDVYAKNEAGHDVMFEAENNNREEVESWLLQRFSVEEAFDVTEDGENTKITYKPGTESKEADEKAKEATFTSEIEAGTASLTVEDRV